MRVHIGGYNENKDGIAVFIPDKSYDLFGSNRKKFNESIKSKIKNLPNGVKLEPNGDSLVASNYGKALFTFTIKCGSFDNAKKALGDAVRALLPSDTTIE